MEVVAVKKRNELYWEQLPFTCICFWVPSILPPVFVASWKQQKNTPHMNTQENHWKRHATHEHTWKQQKNTRDTWTHKKIIEKRHTWTHVKTAEKHTHTHHSTHEHMSKSLMKHTRGKTQLKVTCLWFSSVFRVKCDYPILLAAFLFKFSCTLVVWGLPYTWLQAPGRQGKHRACSS